MNFVNLFIIFRPDISGTLYLINNTQRQVETLFLDIQIALGL